MNDHAGFERALRALVEQDLRSGRDPLLQRLRTGPLDLPTLRLWAAQYYLVVREFARFLSAIHSACPDHKVRTLIAENLYEEHGRFVPGKDHPALMRRFGRSVGLSEEAMEMASPLQETAAYIATLFQLTRERSYLEGLAAVGLGVEAPIPRYFARLEPLLRQQHGLSTEDTEFFRIHIEDDDHHAGRAMTVVLGHAGTEKERTAILEAVREAQTARARFRDAVYRLCVQL